MNREDRELLAELGRLNSDVVPFAMKIMDESVTITAQEQYTFAERLMAMGLRLEEKGKRTASGVITGVIEGAGSRKDFISGQPGCPLRGRQVDDS